MKTLYSLVLLFVSFNTLALDFKIEKDQVFKTILEEFESPGKNLAIYQESENYRFDLTLTDLIDKTTIVLNDLRFKNYEQDLNPIISKDKTYFYDWFKKLKQLAQEDQELFQELDKKLYIQLYSKTGHAIIPEYKIIDFKKIKELGLLRRITRYNEFMNDPESAGLAMAFSKTEQAPFIQGPLTVSKLKRLKKKEIKKIRKAYYKTYSKMVKKQWFVDQSIYGRYIPTYFDSNKNGLKSFASSRDNPYDFKTYNHGIKIFNIINSIPDKQELLRFVDFKLQSTSDKNIAKVHGLYLLTPIFIDENWNKIQPILQEYTLLKSINLEDDEYLLSVRKWLKKNKVTFLADIERFNLENDTNFSFSFIKNKKPKRFEVIRNYQLIEKLYPTRPWMRKEGPDLVDRKGRAKYFDEKIGKKVGRKLKQLFRYLIKLENYTSILTGTAVFTLSAGNAALALSTRSLVNKAVYTLKHDREWKEFLKSAPVDVLNAFLLGTGFSPGRLYKILALGSAQGALQSLVTGQDIKMGAYVGAGISLINYYVLPYSWAKPMTKGFDAASLKTNRILEITATTIKNSVQGTAVSLLTGEDPLKGALKGALFGSVSSSLAIWFLGTRYYPFKDYSDEDIDNMIAAENSFQNDVGRGGEYLIDRQLILDTNHRVNGALPKIISASIALPGNVSMGDYGYKRLTTLTHEASHLMQQHQSGVFGFYLFRYIPTSIFTGYYGHPDENFLRNFLSEYLIG